MASTVASISRKRSPRSSTSLARNALSRVILAAATRLDAAGLSSLVYETCANVPEEGDFLATMRQNLAALESAANG